MYSLTAAILNPTETARWKDLMKAQTWEELVVVHVNNPDQMNVMMDNLTTYLRTPIDIAKMLECIPLPKEMPHDFGKDIRLLTAHMPATKHITEVLY